MAKKEQQTFTVHISYVDCLTPQEKEEKIEKLRAFLIRAAIRRVKAQGRARVDRAA